MTEIQPKNSFLKCNRLHILHYLSFIYSLGGGNCRGPYQHSLGPGLPQQRRMSDESIQSGVIETQEMQAIQVL